jgi:hypothetical protein
MAADKPTPPAEGGKQPRRFTRLELDPSGGPSRVIVDGVDLAAETDDLKETVVDLKRRLDLIYELADIKSDDVEVLNAHLGAIRTWSDLGRTGGRNSGPARWRQKRWTPLAREVAVAMFGADPATTDADVIRAFRARAREAKLKVPDENQPVRRYFNHLRKVGAVAPRPQK